MLCNRSQQVKVGNTLSDYKAVTSGVPQGSVLGPVLFIFYINDIIEAAAPPSTVKLYADDLKAYCSDQNDKKGDVFNVTLKNISSWANTYLAT